MQTKRRSGGTLSSSLRSASEKDETGRKYASVDWPLSTSSAPPSSRNSLYIYIYMCNQWRRGVSARRGAHRKGQMSPQAVGELFTLHEPGGGRREDNSLPIHMRTSTYVWGWCRYPRDTASRLAYKVTAPYISDPFPTIQLAGAARLDQRGLEC